MDRLLQRQASIEKSLAKAHLSKSDTIILYDITSSYLEGEYANSELVEFGYSRDKKKGHPQVVIGLIRNKEGCPISSEIFKGNTSDSTTVDDQILKIKEKFGIKEAVFIGDRGMITRQRLEDVGPEDIHYYVQTISALTPCPDPLLRSGAPAAAFSETQSVVEFPDKNDETIRYGISLNPHWRVQDRELREKLIHLTAEALDVVKKRVRPVTDEVVGIRVGKVINKYKVGKNFNIVIKDEKLNWSLKTDMIEEDEKMDGIYILFTDVPQKRMPIDEVLQTYRKLSGVEQVFRNLKQTQLEIRPVCYKTDERIKAHIFIYMLAYYVMWHMEQRLAPMLEEERPTSGRLYTFDLIIEHLKSIRKNECEFHGHAHQETYDPR